MDLRPYEKLHTIQMLKGIIRRWWKLELAFTDATGYVLDHADGRIAPPNNEFCRLALSSKEGFRRCNESLKATRDQIRDKRAWAPREGRRATARRSLVHECHLGFDLVACPVVFDGELAGLLFVGGSVREQANTVGAEALLRTMRELPPGAKLAPELDAGARALPLCDEAEVAKLCDMLEFGAAEIEAHHAELKLREREQTQISQELNERYRFENIIGTSRPMQQVFRLLEKIIESESTVLIHGESGTGKELVAKAIHYNGPRAKRRFVVQNCSAFNDNLLESALFGHIKGAFTGAIKDTKGLFEEADGGSFFLDEVGDMSPALQVKLLRVLQEGTFTPVGSTETRQTDVRVIAATHKDLQKMVERGEFREDLYYRINVIKVTVPSLRERLDDLELLVDHFLRKHHRTRPNATQRKRPLLAAEALGAMRRYTWPGNIRELENEIERLIVLGGDLDELPAELLSTRVREAAGPARAAGAPLARFEELGSLKRALEQLESELIHRGLIRTHWNKSQLAKELGISRSSLISKAERYGLEKKTE
ncbi:MAG: AAA family ATPase [Myxococcales bacterium]|nr:AAA family ATPase [Myxococcales bacterium]